MLSGYPALVLGLVFLAFALVTAVHALLHKREPRSALGWVACCLLIPYAGPFLYLVFGINRTRLLAHRMRPYPEDSMLPDRQGEQPGGRDFPLAVVGRNVTGRALTACDEVRVLINGDEAYPAMLEAIEGARGKVYLATYIFANGQVAERFLDAMVRARERGADVRIILDGMGECMSFPRIGRQLARRGLPFRRFNPFSLLPPSLNINMRNHRKLLIVDDEVAFTGGTNLADRNLVAEGGRHRIQDLHFRLRGGLVPELAAVFLKDWDYCGGERSPRPYDIPIPAPTPPGDHGAWTRLILDGPNEDLDKLSDILVGSFAAARSRIWIMTPYFLPDAELIGALQGARLRNLDVKVVLPETNNIALTHWAARHMLWQLLNYGVEVYYQPPPFAHSKLLLIDDYYSQVGSANFDPRSLRLNYELSVEIFSQRVQDSLEAYFREKLQVSRRVTRKELESRPFPARLRDGITWLFSPYL